MATKLYIAGKITGDAQYKKKFRKYADKFTGKDFAVLNPANLPEGMAAGDYMKICFAMIDVADLIVFLPDWKESRGARLEMKYCKYVGKKIVELRKDSEI